MIRILYIGIGGAAGALLRYAAMTAAQRMPNGGFMTAVLGINLTGSLVAGFLLGMLEAVTLSPDLRAALFVGVLGSYTTFSAFTVENFDLIRRGEYGLCAWNVALNVVLGTCLVFVGYGIGRALFPSHPSHR